MFNWYFDMIMYLQLHLMLTRIFSYVLGIGLFVSGAWFMHKYERHRLENSKREHLYFILSPIFTIASFVIIFLLYFSLMSPVSNDAMLSSITHYQTAKRYKSVVVPSTSEKTHLVFLLKNNHYDGLSTPLLVSQKTSITHGKSYSTVQLLKLNNNATSLQKSWYYQMVNDNRTANLFTISGAKVVHYESLSN